MRFFILAFLLVSLSAFNSSSSNVVLANPHTYSFNTTDSPVGADGGYSVTIANMDLISDSELENTIDRYDNHNDFISTWELTSSDLTFELPLKNYTNITIDWGDSGSNSSHTNGVFPTHTYASNGTYTITVAVNDAAKDIGQMYMNNHASRTLIRTITKWGEGKWESFDYAFKGATYLTIPATDEPDLSLVTIMSHTFNECTNLVGLTLNDWNTSVVTSLDATFHDASLFNGDISSWNTSNVTTMRNMFKNTVFNRNINTSGSSWNTGAVTTMSGMFMSAGIFNQEIGGWDTSKVTNMYYMFGYSSDFNGDISSWNTTTVTNMEAMFFDADDFNQDLTGWCVSNISSEPSYFSNSSGLLNTNKPAWGTCSYFISTWELTSSDLTFVLPLKEYANITIDWGDDNTDSNVTGGGFPTHIYSSDGTKTITVQVNDTAKDIGEMYLNGHASATLIRTITNWGEGKWETFNSAFKGATHLTIPATDEPDLSLTTNMKWAFRDCTSLVGTTLNDWNTSTVTNMEGTFMSASAFNGTIGSWNTAAVTNMREMFRSATAFNGNITGWNTAAVTFMPEMFREASAFNQDINTSGNSWNVSNVTDMNGLFRSASAFNGTISSWDTSAVTKMTYMFLSATVFNQDITLWNTANVTNMTSLFHGASSFNQAINTSGDSWNTAAVANMSYMFSGATSFNGTISSWNTGAVNNMYGMFNNARVFDQDITSWNTTAVTNMGYMFWQAQAFNQAINTSGSSWNTAAVTNMAAMFEGATAFNQNIGSWNTAAVTNMVSMFRAAYAFNQNIGSWNTAAVTNMQDMFQLASAFNQNIGSWNTAVVANMRGMFHAASAFNQPLAHNGNSWNLANVTNMIDMFSNAGLSTENYDIFLYSQANNSAINSDITITVSSRYIDATSKTYLTETKNWNITDLGQVPTIEIASNISGVADGFSTNDATITLTFTAGLSTSNFEESDITVTNGTLSSFVGSGTTYTVIFTPTEQGVCTINVAAGTFSDSSNNNNNIAASQFNWTFDSVAPTVTNVTSTKTDGSYTIDEVIPVAVTFSEVVNVIETPTLTLETGSSDVVVNYSSGTGSNTLIFNYTVAAGHNSIDLDYVDTSALALNLGTIKDAATNNATLTLVSPGNANSLGANKTLVIDTTAPEITLVGNDTETIEVGATYTEQGATATDNYDSTLTVVVGGDTVDTSIVDTYTVTYNISDSNGNPAEQVARTVSVVDTTIPVITLTGQPTVTIEVGATYTEQGATATDNYDTGLTVVVGGDTVDTTTLGTYTVTYNVSDASGNAAVEVTRTVTVTEVLGLDSTEITSVSIYPNPTTSKWTVESSRVINTLILFNLLGQKVLEQTVNDTKVNIDASNLKTGVYMLKVNKTTLKRVIKR
ncbi:BspA family leucine-rich repeat surface protein [bacterium]|nr:BspA family leucine-rich repeat surface protein [bacterium]